jgi:hypothetical protein
MRTWRSRAEEALGRWREAERRLAASSPGSAAQSEAATELEAARLEYHAILDEQDVAAHAGDEPESEGAD